MCVCWLVLKQNDAPFNLRSCRKSTIIKSHWLPKQIMNVPSIIIVSFFVHRFPHTKNHSRERAHTYPQEKILLEKQNSEISAYLPFSGTLVKEHRSVSNIDTKRKASSEMTKCQNLIVLTKLCFTFWYVLVGKVKLEKSEGYNTH